MSAQDEMYIDELLERLEAKDKLLINYKESINRRGDRIDSQNKLIAELSSSLIDVCGKSEDLVRMQDDGEFYHRCHFAEDDLLPLIQKAILLTKGE